jgi:hypothetical protein
MQLGGIMKTLIFMWVLSMPRGGNHYFDTFKACNNFRLDQKETYGMNVPKCHKEIYNPDGRLMPKPYEGGSINFWYKPEPTP